VSIPLTAPASSRRRHACVLYESRDEAYRRLLPFVHAGFARGEKAYHIVNQAAGDDHVHRLERAGIDVAGARARGQLEVRWAEDFYMPAGGFDDVATMAAIERLLLDARAEGFPATRLLGFVDGILEGAAAQAVIEYESRINRVFARHDDPVVCAYDRRRIPTADALDLLCAHPASLADGALTDHAAFVPSHRFVAQRRGGDPVVALRERYLAALLNDRERDAVDTVVEEGLWLDVPVHRLYRDVVQAAHHEIGRLCRAKRVDVALAHVATEVSRRVLAQLQPHLPAEPRNGVRVVVACVEGEGHDVGARMFADLLEAAGYEVCFAGSGLGIDGLVELVRRRSPRVVALAATTAAAAPALLRTVATLRRALGDPLTIAAGGQIFAAVPALATTLGADVCGTTTEGVIAGLRRCLTG
jgi:MerR family transcriptional regulator, light-induced transcriptional regulator